MRNASHKPTKAIGKIQRETPKAYPKAPASGKDEKAADKAKRPDAGH